MFIELTDILRCPADHEENVLVLLPDGVTDRQVQSGHLGCMECGLVYPVRDGAAEFGPAGMDAARSTHLTGRAMAALLGLGGPGGYVALVGGAAEDWAGFAAAAEGVHVLAVNPSAAFSGGRGASVVRAGRIPVKSRHLRGVVLGPGFASAPAWLDEATRTVLPGLHLVGEGPTPSTPETEVLADADGVWVARVR